MSAAKARAVLTEYRGILDGSLEECGGACDLIVEIDAALADLDVPPPADRVEAGARAAHAAYRAEMAGPSGKLHTPEDCPCRDGHDFNDGEERWHCVRCGEHFRETPRIETRCHACRPAMREWDALTEATRERFRESARPIVAALDALEKT